MSAALLLLALIQQPAADPLLVRAGERLRAPCGEACAPASPDARFRLGDTDEAGPRAPRAVDDQGTRCSVVGARLCTRKPRTIFSTPLPQ